MVLDAVGEDGKVAVFIGIGNLATLIFSYLPEEINIITVQSILSDIDNFIDIIGATSTILTPLGVIKLSADRKT